MRLWRASAVLTGSATAALALRSLLPHDPPAHCDTSATIHDFSRTAPQRKMGGDDEWDGLRQEGEKPVIVGIAGGTGSGKTTVAVAIAQRLGADNLVHISHDSYYRPLNHLTLEERAQTNFDHPDALETSLLVAHLRELKKGNSVEVPMYDFSTHSREPATTTVHPARIILVEGILIYSNEELRDAMDIKIFVDTDSDIRFIRRLDRDIQHRGREVSAIIKQYMDTVRPMHNQFVEPSKRCGCPRGPSTACMALQDAFRLIVPVSACHCRCADTQTSLSQLE